MSKPYRTPPEKYSIESMVSLALEKVTGEYVDPDYILSKGYNLKTMVHKMSSENERVYFMEKKDKGEIQDVKDGMILLTEHDVITAKPVDDGYLYRGVKVLYSPKDIRLILESTDPYYLFK